jgi:Terminase DNA packaging enzyme
VAKDIISQSLGIEPLQDEVIAQVVNPPSTVKNDYEYARDNLYNIIEKGNNALDDIMDIAKQSESARAFEVATNLIKTMVDANKDLLELAKKKKELEKVEEPDQTNVTNNNLFVGSSADLLKMIKGKIDE